MSILIKDMRMLPNCFLCPLSVLNGERLFCEVTKDEVLRSKIPSNCPLVEIPPHGRLIDADALTKMCREMQSIDWNKKAFPYSWEHAYEEFENDIGEAPTVIGAEVDE